MNGERTKQREFTIETERDIERHRDCFTFNCTRVIRIAQEKNFNEPRTQVYPCFLSSFQACNNSVQSLFSHHHTEARMTQPLCVIPDSKNTLLFTPWLVGRDLRRWMVQLASDCVPSTNMASCCVGVRAVFTSHGPKGPKESREGGKEGGRCSAEREREEKRLLVT